MNNSDNYETLKKFSDYLYRNIEIDTLEFNGKTLTLKLLLQSIVSEFETESATIFNTSDHVIGRKFEISLKKIKLENCYIYYDKDDFIKAYDSYKNDFNESIILILNNNGNYILKDKGEKFANAKALVFNYFVYRQLLDYLKENIFFTSLYNSLNKQLIIISKDNGIFYIGYKIDDNRIKDLENLAPIFEELKKSFEKKEFIQFFKEIVTNSGIHEKEVQDRFFEIIKNLKILLSLTEKDYENYVLNFSFDKIKSKFKEERNKYFESLEKNIDSVSKQVVSFPLTFAATAFASYQVKDKPLILILIIIAYSLYTIIAFKVLGISSYNIDCLDKDVMKEEEEIKNNYLKSYEDFKNDFIKINKKSLQLKSLIYFLKAILIFLLVIFSGYSLWQVFNLDKKNEKTVEVPISKIKNIIIETSDSIPMKEKKSHDEEKVINTTKLKDTSTQQKTKTQEQHLETSIKNSSK